MARSPAILLGAALLAAALLAVWWAKRGGDAAPADPPAAQQVDAATPQDLFRPAAAEDSPRRDGVAPAPAASARWRVHGRVTSGDEVPLAGATVRAVLIDGGDRTELSVATSGADGGYACDVGWLARQSRWIVAAGGLEVRAEAPGHQPGHWQEVAEHRARLDEALAARVDLVLQRGATLRGRVVGAGKTPVVDGHVTLTRIGGGDGSTGFGVTDSAGRYAIGIAASGSHWLLARAAEHGFCALGPLDLAAGRDVEVPDLVLTPLGIIEGRAVTPAGDPLPDIDVWVERQEAEAESAPAARGGLGDLPPELREHWDHQPARTRADGGFRFAALQPGAYSIWAEEMEEETQRLVVPTGTRDARLVVDRVLVQLRVVDEAGRPLRGLSSESMVIAPELADAAERSLSARRFDDLDELAEGHIYGGVRNWLLRPGCFVVAVVSLSDAQRAIGGLRVALRPSVQPLDLVVRQVPRLPEGRLRVVLLDPRGTVQRGFQMAMEPIGRDFGHSGGAALASDDFVLSPPVPIGTYEVVARAPDGFRAHSWFLFETRGRIDVVADREVELRLRAKEGGRIRLRIDVASPAENGKLEGFTALTTPAGATQPLPLGPYAIVRGSSVVSAWRGQAGVPMLCRRLLEPGRYTLRVSAKAFPPIERVVDVAGGQVVDVILRP